MTVLRSSFIQRHPFVAGEIWAMSTLALIFVYDAVSGHDLNAFWIAAPAFMLGGLLWGYAMKCSLDRKQAR